MEVAVLADDLSGALESAATFLLRTARINVTVATRPSPQFGHPAQRVQVIDTDSRHASAAQAGSSVERAFRAAGRASMIVKKVDSALRGNIASEIAALVAAGARMVIATALPTAGRTVIDGGPLVNGRPLAESGLWDIETAAAPEHLADVLPPLKLGRIGIAELEGDPDTLIRRLAELGSASVVPICDGTTDAHLDAVVRAAKAAFDRPVLVGSAGIAAAVARSLAPEVDDVTPDLNFALRGWCSTHPASVNGTLIVVGSGADVIRPQLDALGVLSPNVVRLPAADLVDDGRRRQLMRAVSAARAANPLVVVVVAADGALPVDSRSLSEALTEVVGPAAAGTGNLVLTGGETARRIIDWLGIDHLTPLGQVHHGAVISGAPNGQLIATRPGSFGDTESLVAIALALSPHHPEPCQVPV